MRFVKHTQQEHVGISGKISYFAEVYPKTNVQVGMRDPETPAFNCQGRNCVAINCMENLVLVSSVVLVFQFQLSWDAFIMRMKSSQFVHFKYLVYLRHIYLKLCPSF